MKKADCMISVSHLFQKGHFPVQGRKPSQSMPYGIASSPVGELARSA